MKLDDFQAEIATILPPGSVFAGDSATPLLRSTSGHEREVPIILRPRDVAEVQAIVRTAARDGVPLYSVSGGKNWGLGSRLPVRDGCAILDLGGLNRIIDVNERFGVVTLEPGVTQGQLADHLASTGSAFFLDVTGSGRSTSVLGNTLDRGVAYNTLRAELVQSLDIVLADGTVFRTGFSHFDKSRLGGLGRFGAGPDLTGLFVQSNMGVVVGAKLLLYPRPQKMTSFTISLADGSRLGELFEALQSLRREGSLSAIVHVGNRRRSEITVNPLVFKEMQARGMNPTRESAQKLADRFFSGDWSAVGNVMGTPGHVAASKRRVAKVLRGFGKLQFVSPELKRFAKQMSGVVPGMGPVNLFLTALEPLLNLNCGIPSDAALHSAYWPAFDTSPNPADPDGGPGGIAFAAPVVPIEAKAIHEAVEGTYEVGRAHGFQAAITLNLMNDRTLEGVISIDFRRDEPAEVAAAHACLRALNQFYASRGFTPYRIDIGNMDILVDPEDSFWQVAARIKDALDPQAILSPGRFSLR